MRISRSAVGDEAGFSLTESLIALVLFLLVIGAAFGLLGPDQAMAGMQPAMVDMQQRARVATDVLFRDLLTAGSGPVVGPGAGPLIQAFAPVIPRRLGLSGADPYDRARSDAVTLLSVRSPGVQGRLRDPFQPGQVLVPEPGVGCPASQAECILVGQALVAFDGTGRFDLFAAEHVSGGVVQVQALRSDGPDVYPAGTVLAAVDVRTYFLDRAARQLRYYDGSFTDVPVVDDVVDLEFEYLGDPSPPVAPRPPEGQANCLYTAAGTLRPQSVLASDAGSLARLPLSMFEDGPWCGSGSHRYDADLLRIRQVRVRLQLQAAPPEFRTSGFGHLVPGTGRSAVRTVPDQVIQFDVSPRNLSWSPE